MPDAELLLSLAEIAGVFVGFGALIALRTSGPSEATEVAAVRAVMLSGVAAIAAALAPVAIDRYDLTDHQVLAVSSVLVLVAYAGLLFLHARAPETRTSYAALAGYSHRWMDALETVAYLIVVGGPLVALTTIALGVASRIEAALYFTVVVLLLIQAVWTLLWHVFRRRTPQGR